MPGQGFITGQPWFKAGLPVFGSGEGCGDGGGTNIPTCGPCDQPRVSENVTVSLPDNIFKPPDFGATCTQCIDLNGAAVVLPHTSGSAISCNYYLQLGTCTIGVADYFTAVEAILGATGSIRISAGLFRVDGGSGVAVATWFQGGLNLGPDCIGTINESIPQQPGPIVNGPGCEPNAIYGNAILVS